MAWEVLGEQSPPRVLVLTAQAHLPSTFKSVLVHQTESRRQRAYLRSMSLNCSGFSGVNVSHVVVLLNGSPGQSGRRLGLCSFLGLSQDIFDILTLGMDAMIEL